MANAVRKATGVAAAAATAAGIAVSGPVMAAVKESPAPVVHPASGGVAPMAADGSAANPYEPHELCGPGFRIVDDPGGIDGKAARPVDYRGEVWGHVYLLYDRSTGLNCVVTLKSEFVGRVTSVSAWLDSRREGVRTYARYYAGPVKARAANECVPYGGTVSDGAGRTATGGRNSCGG